MASAGCSNNAQSIMAPSGLEARQIAGLASFLFWSGSAILVLVVTSTGVAIFGSVRAKRIIASHQTVIALGLILPAVTLAALLAYSIWSTGRLLHSEDSKLHIKVTGQQWWWRVNYHANDGAAFESANEIHLPVGQPVVFELNTADVIHSFWIPALAGKMDMIPGRTTRLTLTAERPGIYRGQCAEYCGGAHALMAFSVIAVSPNEFAAWLERQRQIAVSSATDQSKTGAERFIAAGCGACHSVRGTLALGTIGPDLTHLGSRRSVGIDQLALTTDNIDLFLRHGQRVKPQNHMPEFGFLNPDDRRAIAAYLLELR